MSKTRLFAEALSRKLHKLLFAYNDEYNKAAVLVANKQQKNASDESKSKNGKEAIKIPLPHLTPIEVLNFVAKFMVGLWDKMKLSKIKKACVIINVLGHDAKTQNANVDTLVNEAIAEREEDLEQLGEPTEKKLRHFAAYLGVRIMKSVRCSGRNPTFADILKGVTIAKSHKAFIPHKLKMKSGGHTDVRSITKFPKKPSKNTAKLFKDPPPEIEVPVKSPAPQIKM